MYVVPGSLDNVVAHIDGLDAATGCLVGFREWLVPRFDDGDNLGWGSLFAMLVDAESVPDADAITRLGELFCEYKDFIDSCQSYRVAQLRIYLRYHAWLLNCSYYKPGTPWYVPPYDGFDVPDGG